MSERQKTMNGKMGVICGVGIAVMVAFAGCGRNGAAAMRMGEAVRLRGYGGEVAAGFTADEARFACDNAAVARTVYSKLLRDLAGMSAARPAVAGNVFTFASGRCATVSMADERTVVVRNVADASATAAVPTNYPPYLDYYDLRALKFYKRPMDSLMGLGVENHWTFANKVGMGGLLSHGIEFNKTKGPGVFSYEPWDFGVDEAAKAGSMLTLSPTFAGAMPLWVYNEHPEKCARTQTHTLVTEWIQGVEGMAFDNDGPGFPDSASPVLQFERDTISRYVNHPGLGGWQFYCGKPIGDQLGKGMDGILWDASEEGLLAQKDWLMRHFTLKELSVRWTGNPDAYRTWADVPSMQLVDLIGGDWDRERWDLFGFDWEWAKAPEKRSWHGAKGWVENADVTLGTLPPSDTRWLTVQMPPSHRCNYVESGRCWYRLRLPKCEWLEKNKDRPLHFRSVVYLGDNGQAHIWANGRKSVSTCGSVLGMIDAPIEAGAFRNDGRDELVVEMPGGRCGGRFAGPVSLSPNAGQNFPYSDPRINARYYDNIKFQNDKIVERNKRVFLAGRAIDRNRPISISGADMPILSDLAPLWAEQGFAMQSTSTDGFYWPHLPDMGRQYGFYFIGEPSRDVAAEDRFDRNFGTIFYTGASSTAVFMDIEQYMKFEQETGGMTARMPVTRLVGKYLIDEPKTGLFLSTLSALMQTGSPYMWNVSRGEMQAVHHDATMTSEKALAQGIVTVERYPILLDCGADVMTDEMVDDIERYVRDGGVFVAFTETGRHTLFKRDAHPFARLSGFRTRDLPGGVQTLTFTAGNSEFPKWSGKTFNVNGYGRHTAANWRYNRALEKTLSDAEVLATYSNGSVAAGVRRVGKGKVITFASGFWREAADIRGKWTPSAYNVLTDELFAQLGMKRVTDASAFQVWTRKATSKDGLEDWLIAFNTALDFTNQSPHSVRTSFAFKTDAKPVRVYDAFTGEDVSGWTYDADGFVRIPECEIGPFKTRIFAAAKDIPPTLALRTWWGEKVKYWKAGPSLDFPKFRPMADSGLRVFDAWEFSVDGGKTWRQVRNRTWKVQFPELKDYSGEAIYRTRFHVPASAKGRTHVVAYGVKTLYDKADLYMNGKRFRSFDQAKVHRELCGDQATDVSGLLKYGGENTLEIRMTGGKVFTAGICDVVWMYEERQFAETVSLNGDWKVVMKDFHTVRPGKIPGRNFGRYLRRKVFVPKSWAGRDIFFRIVTPENTVSSVVINGQGRNKGGGGLEPFANREVVNVTELVKPGEMNDIELWHRRTVPVDWKGKAWGWQPEDSMTIDDVALGVSAQLR